jgi:hypothetical protein
MPRGARRVRPPSGIALAGAKIAPSRARIRVGRPAGSGYSSRTRRTASEPPPQENDSPRRQETAIMQVRNSHDLWSGAMFMAFGLIFLVLSRQYTLGTAAKMGPGYFPTILGGLCFLLGLIISAGAFAPNATHARVAKVGWRELIVVLLSVGLFAALLPQLGIIVALLTLVIVASTASHEFRLRDTLISAAVLLLLSYFVFVKGLELQFPLLPKFMTK